MCISPTTVFTRTLHFKQITDTVMNCLYAVLLQNYTEKLYYSLQKTFRNIKFDYQFASCTHLCGDNCTSYASVYKNIQKFTLILRYGFECADLKGQNVIRTERNAFFAQTCQMWFQDKFYAISAHFLNEDLQYN